MSSKTARMPAPGVDRVSPAPPVRRPAATGSERIAAWRRWEMTSLLESEPDSIDRRLQIEIVAEPPVERDLGRMDEELARLRHDAEQAGRAQGREQGYAEGRAQGQSEGYAAGLAAARDVAERLGTLAQALPAALHRVESEIAGDLVTLALDVARQVVRRAFAADPGLILAVVRDLLLNAPAMNDAPRLVLHPDDVALVQQHLAHDLEAAGWLICGDETLTRGGCRVDAASGELDATLEARWEQVAATLGQNRTRTG